MCLHNTFYHSTIFKTITDDLGNAKLSINNGFKELFSGNFFSRQSVLSDSDINALRAYNAEIERGISPMTAYYRTMQKASDAAINLAYSAGNATVNLEQIPKVSKAAEAATKALAVVGNMIAMWAISKVVSSLYELSQVSVAVAQKAKDLGSSFKTTISDIDSCKSKIEDLYKVINDSESSISDVTNARKSLLSIQDELIDKFGEEKETIDLITQAVNGQSDAWIKLTQNQWEITKKDFNESGFLNSFANWRDGYSDNIDRMVDEMENVWENIKFSTHDYFSGEYDTLISNLERAGWEYSTYAGVFIKSGTVENLYEEMQDIKNLVGYDAPTNFLKSLEDGADELKDTLDHYEDMWDEYILNDRIFTDETLADNWKEVNDAYTKYQEAVHSGNNTVIEEAVSGFADSINTVLNNTEVDESVKDYFRDMYPLLYREVEKWEFKTKILPEFDIHGLNGLTQGDVLGMLQTEGEQYGEATFNSILRLASNYGIIIGDDTEKIEQLLDLLVEWGILQDNITDPDTYSDIFISDIFALKDVEDNATALSDLSDRLSEVEDAYNTCLAAKEEYDEQGYLSIDTLQKVLSLGDEYLQYLFDEEGNVSLDTEAFQQLALARINDMEAQALSNLAKNIQQITDEATATEYLNQKQNELANSYTDVAASALLALSSIDGFSDSTALQNAYNSFKTQYEQIKSLFASTRNGLEDTFSGISDSAAKAAEDAAQATKDYIEAYMDFQKESLEAGKTDYNTYCNSVSELLNSMYQDGKISAQDYHNYIGQMLDEQLSIYDKALSAVTRRIDKEINGIEAVITSIEKQNDALENQLDNYDTLLSIVDSVYEAEIDRIKAEQDAIQDTIDALQDENDERELALQLEQAKYDLYRAQTQRTKKVFNGTEFVYETDQDAIREAQENLTDLTLEQTVSGLETEKDALDSVIEELEYYQSLWAKISTAKETEENRQLAIALWGKDYESIILSNRISDIDAFKNNYISIQDQINDNEGLIASYEEKIEYYEALKEQWSSISDAYEQTQEDQYAAMLLGQNWEAEVLSGRTDTLNQFKDDYISIQQAIVDAAWASANEQIKAAQEAEKAAAGIPGNGEKLHNDDPEPDSTMYHIVDTVTGGTLVYSSTSEGNAKQKLAALNAYEADQGRYYIKKYAAGTSNAKRGINLVGEEGTETYIDNDGNIALVTKPTLIPMEGGETVKNAAETKSLLDMDNLVPVETFEFTGIDGEKIRLNADELQQRVLSIMPNYSNVVQPPMMQSPKCDALPVQNNTTPVIQNITLTLPNVTNTSGYERIQKELKQMQIDAYQFAHKR